MAYTPGSQIKQFFKTGGITLTDKSPGYKTGKIPLFKSLKGLNARERLYAVGYNFSTLGAFGLNFGSYVSIPYMIGEYTNTARSVMKNLRQPQVVMQGQFIKRQKLLAGAKSVGKAKSAVSRALRTGTPVDRATNIVLGRESAGMLQNIREFGTAGGVVKVLQEANAGKIDKQLQMQAQIASKDNVFMKWQTLTFTEAWKNTPNPFFENPVRKAEKVRYRTVETRGQQFNMDDFVYRQNLMSAIDAGRANQLMSLSDGQNFQGHVGMQKDIVAAMMDAEGEQFFRGSKDYAKYKRLSQDARMEMYEQARYHQVGRVMGSGSPQTRDYRDRELLRSGLVPSNTTLVDEIGLDGKRKRVQDIIYSPETGRSSSYKSRKLKDELNTDFLTSFYSDIGPGGTINPTEMMSTLSSFEMGPDVMNSFKSLARAFNLPVPKNLNGMSGSAMIDTLTTMASTVSNLEIKAGFFVGQGMQVTALESFIKTLNKNGYQGFAKTLRSRAGFRRKAGDPMAHTFSDTGFMSRRAALVNVLQPQLNNGVIYSFASGMPAGDIDLKYRFQPSGELIQNKQYLNEILNKRTKPKFGTRKIILSHFDEHMNDPTRKASFDNVTRLDDLHKIQ